MLHSGRHFIAHVDPPTPTITTTTVADTTASLAACSLSQSSLVASLSTYLATTNCVEVSADLSAICEQKILAAKLHAEENQMEDNDYEGFLTSDTVFSSSAFAPQVGLGSFVVVNDRNDDKSNPASYLTRTFSSFLSNSQQAT